ncbi:acyl carrier protein [Acetonema longum]|uniref:Acyl carrier protein n=1 Tax=Acetonema longum DSM 6540 TaxID=1009370 RepID=F7NK95_9FIRM|nr:acyl carrier protein [Acetonema longum]EGO63536.1 hypothetical protein ALO_12541 [Acetonema longum DSM 6540]
MTVFESIQEIIMNQTKCNMADVTIEADLVRDCGCDSLDLLEIVLEVEDKYNIDVTEESAGKWKTVRDLVEHVKKAAGIDE